MDILENWLTRQEAAELALRAENTISYHASRGRIETMKLKNHKRKKLFKKSDIIEVFEINKEKDKLKEEKKKPSKENTIIVNDEHCKNCCWKKGPVCPFRRCVKHHNWAAEEKYNAKAK